MLRQIKSRLPWVRLIKTIHVGAGGEIEKAKAYEGCADAILLDTLSPSYGGTGKVHDWTKSAEIIKAIQKCPCCWRVGCHRPMWRKL